MFLPWEIFKTFPNIHVKALFENSLSISHLHQISNYNNSNSQGRVEDFHIHNALLTRCEADFYPGTYGDYTSQPCSEDLTIDPSPPPSSKQKRQLQKLRNVEQQDYHGIS